jgi:hypothetical protein
MPRKKTAQPNRAELLAAIPPNAHRVKVQTDTGQTKFKAPDMIARTDVILTKKDGTPYLMMSKPGRPRTPDLSPANATVAELLNEKARVMSEDQVLQTATDSPESSDVLHQVMIGLADEAASISFERKEAERKGEPTSQLSVRRVNALKSVAETWLRRKDQLVNQLIDMESTGFHTLFQLIVETFKGALEDSEVHPEMIKVVFARFSKKVGSEEWKAEAKARMRKNL